MTVMTLYAFLLSQHLPYVRLVKYWLFKIINLYILWYLRYLYEYYDL